MEQECIPNLDGPYHYHIPLIWMASENSPRHITYFWHGWTHDYRIHFNGDSAKDVFSFWGLMHSLIRYLFSRTVCGKVASQQLLYQTMYLLVQKHLHKKILDCIFFSCIHTMPIFFMFKRWNYIYYSFGYVW